MTERRRIRQVLVVCTGNTCRSPMAAGILARMLDGTGVSVSSAGIGAAAGAGATPEAQQAAAELGADIRSHRARQLEPPMLQAADLVLVMAERHRAWVRERTPEVAGRVRLLAAYPSEEGPDVADPLGGTIDDYRMTALKMKTALLKVAADIRRQE